MPPGPGARLGPYELTGSLGTGGMGEVFRARDTRLRRDVAIKVISGDGKSDADRRQRFQREARAIAALSHPPHLHHSRCQLRGRDGKNICVWSLSG